MGSDGEAMQKGSGAEEFVARALKAKGWKVLARNFRRVGTEIDIIAHKGRTLIFVEVKERQSFPCTGRDLEQLLPSRKRHALQRGAVCFLSWDRSLPTWDYSRLDLAIVSRAKGQRVIRYWVGV
ncbi:MAG: YraN family protein [Deltaproteobacteria bacterium]|nr:YraN family protein [Deltaproteobacteria bacterium]